MQAVDFIFETLAHFAKRGDGPPPGIPARVEPEFERELIRICERHSLAPIVLESLAALTLEPVLSEFGLERLKTLSRESEAGNERLLEALDSLTVGFRREGVSFLLVGGVAAALDLYPSIDLRPLNKIDLLIRDLDWLGILEACRGAGFRRSEREPIFNSAGEALFYHQHFGPLTLENTDGVVLCLKFRLRDLGPAEQRETAWDRAHHLGGGYADLSRVGLEDLLIRCCVRLVMSRFGNPLAAVDAGLILARHGANLDWGYIQSRTKSFCPAFYFSCHEIASWLNISVPANLRRPSEARKKLFDVFWHPGRMRRSAEAPSRLRRFQFYMIENGSLREKLTFLTTLLSPRADWVSAFFGRPCKPWLKMRYSLLAFRDGLGMPFARGRDLWY
ncbi:MAG: nucleotidyltransferase family protein [Candidatus Latescibacterota bacterium]|nr:MAG: nucleotidyltransferase family protein [Candidatus Latescibacterota bacterium]